jgi:hypothetical protein
MDEIDLEEHLFKVLVNAYGMPSEYDPDKTSDFAKPYYSALKGYPKYIIINASQLIVRNDKIANFPTPGECLLACRDARENAAVEFASRYR